MKVSLLTGFGPDVTAAAAQGGRHESLHPRGFALCPHVHDRLHFPTQGHCGYRQRRRQVIKSRHQPMTSSSIIFHQSTSLPLLLIINSLNGGVNISLKCSSIRLCVQRSAASCAPSFGNFDTLRICDRTLGRIDLGSKDFK